MTAQAYTCHAHIALIIAHILMGAKLHQLHFASINLNDLQWLCFVCEQNKAEKSMLPPADCSLSVCVLVDDGARVNWCPYTCAAYINCTRDRECEHSNIHLLRSQIETSVDGLGDRSFARWRSLARLRECARAHARRLLAFSIMRTNYRFTVTLQNHRPTGRPTVCPLIFLFSYSPPRNWWISCVVVFVAYIEHSASECVHW